MPAYHYPAIDFIKGIGIISVLVLHAGYSFPVVDQAVPNLVFCMGVTGYLSFQRWRGIGNYFLRKALRYLPAWGVVFPVAVAMNNWVIGYGLTYYAILLLLPCSGPGNYFLGIITQSIFVIPMLCWVYQKNRIAAVAGSAIIQAGHYLAVSRGLFLSATDPALEEMLITGYVFTLMLGIVAGDLMLKGFKVPDLNIWPINEAGKASYHIFLVQIVYFCLPVAILPAIASILLCMGIGWVFWKAIG